MTYHYHLLDYPLAQNNKKRDRSSRPLAHPPVAPGPLAAIEEQAGEGQHEEGTFITGSLDSLYSSYTYMNSIISSRL